MIMMEQQQLVSTLSVAFEWFWAYSEELASATSIPSSQARMMIGLVFSIVLAPFLHIFPTANLRHLYCTSAGMYLAYAVFKLNIAHSLVSSVVAYLMLCTWPRASVGKAIATAAFSHLLYCHIQREIWMTKDVVFDSAQMVIILKLTALGFNYSDGANEKSANKNALTKVPDFLSYMSYIYFFPTLLVGPTCEYLEFKTWIQEHRKPPFSVHFRNIFVLLVSAGGYALSTKIPVKIDSSDFYSDHHFVTQTTMRFVAVMLYRFRFYLVWTIADTSACLAGAGRNLKEEGKWNRIRNIELHLVEVSPNLRTAINNWNIRTAEWLNTYVYQRVGLSAKTGRPTALSTFATFFVSAFWHGLLPGYYMFFITAGLYLEVAKEVRRRFRPIFHYSEDRKAHPYAMFLNYKNDHPLAFFYDLGGIILSWGALQYIGMAFVLLDYHRALMLWKELYFLPHIIPALLIILFKLFPQKKKSS